MVCKEKNTDLRFEMITQDLLIRSVVERDRGTLLEQTVFLSCIYNALKIHVLRSSVCEVNSIVPVIGLSD